MLNVLHVVTSTTQKSRAPLLHANAQKIVFRADNSFAIRHIPYDIPIKLLGDGVRRLIVVCQQCCHRRDKQSVAVNV